MINDLIFNNKSLYEDFGAFIKKGYEMPTVTEDINDIEVEGNPFGTLTQKTGNYKDLVFNIDIKFKKRQEWQTTKRIINKWLANIKDNRLIFKENTSICTRVKRANFESVVKDNVVIEGTLNFVCEPFYYDTEETYQEWEKNTILKCYTDIEATPIIEVDSKGQTSLTINGKEFAFNYNGVVIIDSARGIFTKETKKPINSTGEFPTIKEGDNTLNAVGVNKIKINTKNRYRY